MSKSPDFAGELRCALDPVAFAEERLILDGKPLRLDPWQKRFLRADGDVLLNNCRQSGKSTCMAVTALHTILYRPGSLVLIVSPGARQSLEAFAKVKDFLRYSLSDVVRLDKDRANEFTTGANSRLVGLPDNPDAIRGYSRPALVIEDEAARCSEGLYVAVLPMLAVSNGRHIQASTGNGKQGHFYRDWTEGGDEWTRFAVPARDCPRISNDFLAKMRKRLAPPIYVQEFECEFTEAVEQVFSGADIEAARSEDLDGWLNAPATRSKAA